MIAEELFKLPPSEPVLTLSLLLVGTYFRYVSSYGIQYPLTSLNFHFYGASMLRSCYFPWSWIKIGGWIDRDDIGLYHIHYIFSISSRCNDSSNYTGYGPK
ncbi:hypothetical protein F4776DRAFT_393469 [Hypoxylon sp. NC0597]|nr:hypothetical protein F4776DRAFT_393469 [Hypoxylon sp. NC0597]